VAAEKGTAEMSILAQFFLRKITSESALNIHNTKDIEETSAMGKNFSNQ